MNHHFVSVSALIILLVLQQEGTQGWQTNRNKLDRNANKQSLAASRRDVIGGLVSTCGAVGLGVGSSPKVAWSAAAVQDSLDVDAFLRRGVDGGGNMGVSSQAGKSRPETGVFLRDGSEVFRNKKTGDVNAEIVVNGNDGEKMAVFVTYSTPWPLGKNCRFGI